MKKTTICRSSRIALSVAALVVAAGVLPAPAQQTGQQPAVHVVQTGETLWTLAERYFGDPLLWPEIYRMNTLVVEDPHWIFPGEELNLTPGRAVAVGPGDPGVGQPMDDAPLTPDPLPAPAPPPPATGDAPTVFARQTGDVDNAIPTARFAAYRYRPVRQGEFYAAGFLTEEERLPWARVTGTVGALPREQALGARSSAVLFEEIDVQAPETALYQIGDTLLVATIGREIDDWGNVVVPTGLVRVSQVSGRNVRATVVKQFARVTDGQVAIPIEPFRDPGLIVPVPVENGVMGRIISRRDRNRVALQQDIVFIDLGRADGIVPGDVFEVLRPPRDNDPFAGGPSEQAAVMHVVHVRERSASALLTHLTGRGADAGDPVRLIRKMPS